MANEMSAPSRRAPIRLGDVQRIWVYVTMSVLWVSGALWLLFHYFFPLAGPLGPSPRALENWWLRLHGLAMMMVLVVFGMLLVHHAGRAWPLRRNQQTGAWLLGTCMWLAISGYGLLYFPADASDSRLPLLHWVPGLAAPLALIWHVAFIRVRRATTGRVAAGRERGTAMENAP